MRGTGCTGAKNAPLLTVQQQNDVQQRMPSGKDWKGDQGRARSAGTAGTCDEDRREKRNSPIVEISLLLAECIQHGLRTIAFCKTRKTCELVASYTREVRYFLVIP